MGGEMTLEEILAGMYGRGPTAMPGENLSASGVMGAIGAPNAGMTWDEMLRIAGPLLPATGAITPGAGGAVAGNDYQALLDLYRASSIPAQNDGSSVYYAPPVALPDGSYLNLDGLGNPITAIRNGGQQQVTTYTPGGSSSATLPYNDDNWKTSLAGAIGVGIGGPLLGGAANALLGGGASAAGAGTMAGVPGIDVAAGGAAAGGAGGAGMMAGVPGIDVASGAAGTPGAGGLGSILSGIGNAAGGAASNLLSNPALLAGLLGGIAGVAGNDDINTTSSSTANSTSNSATNSTANSTGTSNTSGTTTTGLAPWMQGYAQDYLSRVNALTQGSGVPADLANAQGMMRNLAANGDPLVNQAMGQQSAVIGGGYLNGNPYIDKVASDMGSRMAESYALGTRGGLVSQAALGGGGGQKWDSGAQQLLAQADRSFGDSLGSAMNNLYYGNYANERAAQDAAARSSTGLANFGVNNLANYYGSGMQQQQWPYQQLSYLGSAINPAWGSVGTNNQTGNTTSNMVGSQTGTNTQNQVGTKTQNIQAPSNWAAALGGAAGGLGIYSEIFG